MRHTTCKLIILFILIIIIIPSKIFSQDFWIKSFNPTPAQKAGIYCFALNAQDEIFAGRYVGFSGSNAGILRSTDNGVTWLSVGLRKYDILSMAASPDGYIYAGTIGKGSFRSPDNGMTWDSLGPSNETVYSICIGPDRSVYIGTAGNGVYKYKGLGTQWDYIGLHPNKIDVLISDSSGNLFASSYFDLYSLKKNETNWNRVTGMNSNIRAIVIDSNKNLLVATETRGVQLSKDNGLNWTDINGGLTSLDVKALSVNSIGHLFAVISGQGVYRSVDYGKYWSKLETGMDESSLKSIIVNQKGYVFTGSDNSGVIFRSLKSSSGGIILGAPRLISPLNGSVGVSNNTSVIWNKLLGAEIYNLQLSENQEFTGSSVITIQTTDTTRFLGGLYYNTKYFWRASGINSEGVWGPWSEPFNFTTELPPKVFWQYTYGPNSVKRFFVNKNNSVFALSSTAGIYISNNNGKNWSGFYSFNGICYALAIDSGKGFYAGVGPGGLLYSTDNGGNWNPTNLWDDDVHSILIMPNGDIIAGGVGKIYKSTDKGINWLKVQAGYGVISDIIHNKKNNYIFASSRGYGVFVSKNGGASWENIGLLNNYVMNIVFDSKDYLYAATEDSGVFRSSNFGATWNKIFSITCNPTNYLTSMVISPNDKIFIGYSVDGVFQSTDNGNSWTNRETGLTSKEVFSLGIDKDGYIYAGTFMNGIFRSIISAFVTVPKFNNKIPENFILEQNYPNPFNPLTKIRYSIPYECIVKLKIYDALGREIKTAVNEVQRPGSYILDIDASGLSSGVYFYSLQAGDFNQAKKFILMR